MLLLFVGAQNGLIAQSIGQGKSEDKSELKKKVNFQFVLIDY